MDLHNLSLSEVQNIISYLNNELRLIKINKQLDENYELSQHEMFIINFYKIVKVFFYIDWNQIDKKFNYIAMDSNGAWYMYIEKPYVDHEKWLSKSGSNHQKLYNYSFGVGKFMEFTETLLERDKQYFNFNES